MFGMVEQDTGRSLVFRITDRQRETLLTRLVCNEGQNGITKAKLPGYLDEFNWSKLHQEANLRDRFHYMMFNWKSFDSVFGQFWST